MGFLDFLAERIGWLWVILGILIGLAVIGATQSFWGVLPCVALWVFGYIRRNR